MPKKKPKTKPKKTVKKTGTKKAAKKSVKKPSKKPAKAKKPVGPAKKAVIKKPVTRPARGKGKVSAEEMEAARKEALRRLLVKRREEIVREAKTEIKNYITGENRQLVETALDDGDWSVVDLSEDISLRKLTTHREVLLRIDEALRKLREGTYGICEECGEEISPERLRILPFAIYCRDCQEKNELLEAVEKKGER